MSDLNNVQIVVYPSMFNQENRFLCERSSDLTFKEIYNSLCLDYDIEYVVFTDGDKIVTDLNSKPEYDIVGVKVLPSGGNTRNQGIGMKVGGAALAIAGGVLIATGFGAPLGVALIGTGVSLMLSGYVMMNMKIPKISGTPESKAEIKGSQNQTRINERVPILLGKSIIYPDNAASPYIDYSGSTQYLVQMFCAGYNNIDIDTSTYKIGETKLASPYYTYALETFQSGTSAATVYPKRKTYSVVGTELDYDSSSKWYSVRQTPSNTKEIRTTFQYPSGRTRYMEDGDRGNLTGYLLVEIYRAGEIITKVPSRLIFDLTGLGSTMTLTNNGFSGGYYNYTLSLTNGATFSSLVSYDKFATTIISGTEIYEIVSFSSGNSVMNFRHPTVNTPSATYSRMNVVFRRYTATEDPLHVRVKFVDNTNTINTFYQHIDYTLDNVTTSDADYVAGRKYDVLTGYLMRDDEYRSSLGDIDTIYFYSLNCTTGYFDGSTVSTNPIISPYDQYFTIHQLKLMASQNAQGVVNQFNFVGTSKCPIYSGSGSGALSWSTVAATRNPAALALYILRSSAVNPKPVDDAQIDFASFEAWYTFCATKGFYYDYFEKTDVMALDHLNYICNAGRASFDVEYSTTGKVRIIIEDEKTIVTQLITPRNSFNFSCSKSFSDALTGLKCKFVDASTGYQQSERIVYVDDDNPNDENLQDVEYRGVTDATQVYKLAKYQLACSLLRQRIVKVDMDIEHILAKRGDRVIVNHDIMFSGQNRGKIVSLIGTSGAWTGIVTDEYITLEAGVSYAVSIRLMDGTIITKAIEVQSLDLYTDTLNFTTPSSASLERDCLFAFGETGEVYTDMLVVSKEMREDGQTTLTLVDYAPAVYNADSGTIPEWNPLISFDADYSDNSLYSTKIDPVIHTQIISTSEVVSSVNGNILRPVFSGLTDITLADNEQIIKYCCDSTYLYYQNKNGGIYRKNLTDATNGDVYVSSNGLITTPDYYIDANSELIYSVALLTPILTGYTSGSDEEKFMKSVHVEVDSENGYIYSVNRDSGNIYRLTVPTSAVEIIASGTLAGSMFVDGQDICYVNSDGDLVYFDIIAETEEVIQSNCENIFRLQKYGSFIGYIDATDSGLYLTNGTAVKYLSDIRWFSVCEQNIIYTATTGRTMSGVPVPTQMPTKQVKATIETVRIDGDFTASSALITGLTDYEMERIEVDDILTCDNLPEGTTIILKGENQITVSNPAIATGTFDITIVSERAVLSASQSLATGSILPELLSPNFKFGFAADGDEVNITKEGNYDVMVSVSGSSGYSKYFVHVYFSGGAFHSEHTLLAGSDLITFTDSASNTKLTVSSGTITILPLS